MSTNPRGRDTWDWDPRLSSTQPTPTTFLEELDVLITDYLGSGTEIDSIISDLETKLKSIKDRQPPPTKD